MAKGVQRCRLLEKKALYRSAVRADECTFKEHVYRYYFANLYYYYIIILTIAQH